MPIWQKEGCVLKIRDLGLGYVSAASAGCLANDGHKVIRVNQLGKKLELISEGRSPIVEADIAEIIASNVTERGL
jgi:GDP-mannose 6-dehydrogenase